MKRDASRVARFLHDGVRRKVGTRWHQGRWDPPLARDVGDEALELIATIRLWRVPRVVAASLVAWAEGLRDVDLLERVPTPREVLARQARGRRCVSLLDDDALATPHADALAFTLHDLCHLEKFVDEEHHAGQVGFFATAHEALATEAYRALASRLDRTFQDEVDHVVADMNGSAVFLFAALKMKLKMAVRRWLAAERGEPAKIGGPLDERERARYLETEMTLLDLFGLHGVARDAAAAVSTKRDSPALAAVLLGAFESRGREVLRCP